MPELKPNNKLPGYFDEESRKDTYKTWIFNKNKACNAAKMAEAGFIFTGSSRDPDSVQCFFCSKSLDGWEEDDDPWTEHLKHASLCEFAKTQKPQNEWLFCDWLQLLEKYRKILVERKYEGIEKMLMKSYDGEPVGKK